MKYLLIILTLCSLTACAQSGGYGRSSAYNDTQYVRDTKGNTLYKIQDGNIYTPNGTRTAKIDSSGNIYSTRGATAGQRVGRISK